jgi:hypothetical protein
MKPEPHNFLCLWLVRRTKDKPIMPYKKDTDKAKLPRIIPDNNSYNYAVLTGKENNIIVVDIDSYKFDDDSIFKKAFPDYLKIKTYITQTPNGGHHLYFKYDEQIKQTASELFIDIRSNNGYVVGAGSKTHNGLYKIFNNDDICEIPEDLKIWILDNLYKRKNKEIKIKDNKKHYEDYENIQITDEEKKDLIKHITKKLNIIINDTTHKNFFKSYMDFLYFTSAMKELKQKKLWDDFSKTQEGYNEEKNNEIWNGSNKNMIPWLIKKLEFTAYELFKPKLPNIIKPHKIVNVNKITNDYKNIYDDNKISYIIKSDTGTGKTFSFSEFIRKNKYQKNFISIVSRVTLAEEQYKTFNDKKYNIPAKLYNIDDYDENDGYICQIDSIYKIDKLDNIKNKIIFLDEFNSIIQYIISSSTLKNKRLEVFEKLEYIIKNCKLFIATDADISDLSIKFINDLNVKYKYIENTFKHNKGINATEIYNEDELIKELQKNKKWILCCDSIKVVNAIYKKLNDKNILKITSENDEFITEAEQKEKIIYDQNIEIKFKSRGFDDFDKIMYSPKILYGIDSSINRPVYCYYKEHTISSEQMIQQIARCRNIIELKFIFTKKSYKPNLTTLKELENDLKIKNDYANNYFNIQGSKDLYNRYFELLVIYEYNKLCDDTNKFGHFLNLIKIRGFNYIQNEKHTLINKKQNKKLTEEMKKELIDNFDIDNYKVQDLNKILNIPRDEMKKYAEFYIDQYRLNRHFLISSFLFKSEDDIYKTLNDRKDFNLNKLRDGLSKVLFLKKLKKTINDNNLYNLKSNVKDNDTQEIKKEYKTLFNDDYDFKDDYKNNQILYKIYKHLFGECVTKERIKTKGKNRDKYNYNFIDNVFDTDEEVYKFREVIKINNKVKLI